ncbi:sulfatase [Flammeovirgaceae bacterium 311]|nr:sulfatase [Flammeovirgaceae bacterium 311]
MRKLFILSIIWVGLLPFDSCFAQVNKKPNIILILADDLGWSDLPSYGNKFNEAPNLDRMASEGMLFTNAYSASPVCSPARAAIISGQYPARLGIVAHIPGHHRPFEEVQVPNNRTQYLPAEVTTIAEALKSAGYATGFFGKWHLGDTWHMPKEEVIKYHPLQQGFDEANIGQGYYNVKFLPEREEFAEERFNEQITKFGMQFIDKHKDRPLFLVLSHYDVHVRLNADADLINKYLNKEKDSLYPSNAIYAAMIEHLDRSVGSVLKKLKETGLSENTVVVFYSDNGGLVTEHDYETSRNDWSVSDRMDIIHVQGHEKVPYNKDKDPLKFIATSNAPLRNEKGTVFEGGIRVPMIVKWPQKIKPGTKNDALVTSVDFFPTFLELAGVRPPKNVPLDGKSVVKELHGENPDQERAIFWHYPVFHHDVPAGAVRKGDWKLIQNFMTGEILLFNLKTDISESTNLASHYPEKADELLTLLKDWQKEIKAEFPKPNPHFDKQRRYEWALHPDLRRQ